jgi:hypothetical protein
MKLHFTRAGPAAKLTSKLNLERDCGDCHAGNLDRTRLKRHCDGSFAGHLPGMRSGFRERLSSRTPPRFKEEND